MANPRPDEPDRDEAFLGDLVRRGWATEGQLVEARRLMAAAHELGQPTSYDDILLHKGFVSADRITTARREVAASHGKALRIGKYEILERLGEGGAGIVYRAYQTTLGREVALKVLSRKREADEEYLDRFLREAKVAVTLNHVNVVRGLDFGKADGYHYFAMELVEGESLMAVVRREGRLQERKALDIALQMVRALEHAQTFQIVHRDIKPENILLTRSGTAKLADLGLARPRLEGVAAEGAKHAMGTALYAAPEQIRRDASHDFRADIYSLGATIFHALTGTPPFTGQTAGEIVKGHLSSPVPNPRERVMDISQGAAAVVMKMLAKDPAERYLSLEALDQDLDSVLDGRPPVNTITLGRKAAPLSAESAAELAARRTTVAARGSRRGLLLVSVLFVGISAVAAWALLRPPEQAPAPSPGPAPAPLAPPDGGMGAVLQERENEAAAALRAAEELAKARGESSPEAAAKYLEVANAFGGTSAGRVAQSNFERLEKSRRERIAASLRKREQDHASALAAGRLGAALAAWDGLDGEEASGGGKEGAEAARGAVEREADARVAGARALAERVVRGEDAAEPGARAALKALAGLGLARTDEAAAAALRDLEAAVGARRRALAAAEEAWPAACADALQAATRGAREGAAVLDARAAVLEPIRGRVEALREALGEIGTFLDSVRTGFARSAAAGETVRLRVPGRPGGVVAGRAAAARADSLEVQRGPALDAIPLAEVEPGDLAALAWKVLGAGTERDHAAACAFLLSRGAFTLAEGEVRALEVLGAKESAARASALLEAARSAGRARADAAVREADLFRLQKRLPEARASLERAAALCDGYALPLWRLGDLLLESSRDPAEALRPLEAAAALGPAEPEAWYAIAEGRRRAGKVEEAVAAFERFLATAPPDAAKREPARRALDALRAAAATAGLKQVREDAARAFRRDAFAEAEEGWRKVLVAAPDDTEAMYFLGKSLVGLDRKVEAYSWLRRFLNADRRGGSRVEDARKVVKEYEQRFGDSPAAARKSSEGSNLVNTGKWKEAVDAFTASLDLAPLRPETWAERARALLAGFRMEGRRDLAQQALRDAETSVLINEKLGRGWSILCIVAFDLGDYARAADAGAKGVALDPSYAQVYEFRARACCRVGRFAEAEQAATEGIAKEPRAVLFLARAEARCGLGNLKGARADLDVSVRDYELLPVERTYRGEVLGKVLKAEKGSE